MWWEFPPASCGTVLGGFALSSACALAGYGDNTLYVNLDICRQHALAVMAPPLSYQDDGNESPLLVAELHVRVSW